MADLQRIIEEGLSLADEGRRGDALDCYGRALELDPSCLFACVSKGIILMDAGMHREALELFEGFDIMKDDTLASWAFYHKAMAFYHMGRLDDAVSHLDMVDRSDPNYAGARYTKAVLLEDYYDLHRVRARLEEALLCYDEAVAANPDFPEAIYNKGLVLCRLDRPEDAVKSFEKAIGLAPDFADVYDSKGSALNSMGRHEEALLCYDEAVRLRSDFAEAIYNKANSLYCLDRIEESAQLLDKAVRLNPKLPDHAGIRAMLDERLEFKRRIRSG